MTRLDAPSYLAHLRRESTRFRDVLAAVDPAVRVPACPDWDADDLLWHLAEVQWFWGQVVALRPAGPPAEHPDRPGSRRDLLAFFDDVSGRLCDALAAAGPEQPAWSWSDEQTVGFTFRRQAHEALVHRLDAEQAAGQVTDLPAELAADGVAELVEVMYGGTPPDWGTFTPSGHHVRLELTDLGLHLRVATGHFVGTEPESGTHVDSAHLVRVGDEGDADAVVSGPAAALDAWLWRRRDDEGITVAGDEAAYAGFRAAVDSPLD